MEFKALHDWNVSTSEAQAIQRHLAARVSRRNETSANPRFIAGVDISAENQKGIARAAVVMLSYPELELVEVRSVERRVDFPYVPGLLSFRESPLIVEALEELATTPDLMLVDGQGLAHPRRFGIACHLGLLLDIPTLGCAKSILVGRHEPVGEDVGSYAELLDRGEVVGVALRTKAGASPVYVSIGHKVDLPSSIHWVMSCCRGYRIPEPTRLAHLAAGGKLSEKAPQAQRGQESRQVRLL
ncbi:MAG: deoxyribonuclease V [Chloroflexi bacterium]|nr:deoxyribonuclease V [Chloroflexota bacterium]